MTDYGTLRAQIFFAAARENIPQCTFCERIGWLTVSMLVGGLRVLIAMYILQKESKIAKRTVYATTQYLRGQVAPRRKWQKNFTASGIVGDQEAQSRPNRFALHRPRPVAWIGAVAAIHASQSIQDPS